MANDIPACDICVTNDATSREDGIYRCEFCERVHQRLARQEDQLAAAQAHDHFARHAETS